MFDFDKNEELIEIGYQAALKQIPEIQKRIEDRTYKSELMKKRAEYRETLPKLIFEDVKINGLTNGQSKYIRNSMRIKNDSVSAKNFESQY